MRSASLGGLLALAVALSACVDPQIPPILSLDGPTEMALARTCIQADGVRSRISNCLDDDGDPDATKGVVNEFAFVTNRLGNSLAVISFQGRIPAVIDTANHIPGQTHIPVGRGPTFVRASSDGNFLFVYNEVDGDLSVVSEELRSEITRVPLTPGDRRTPEQLSNAVVSAIFVVPDRQDPDRDAIWVVHPGRASISEVRWQFRCGDQVGIYTEGCAPEIVDVEMSTLYTFNDGAKPQYAAQGPNGDLWVTFIDRAVAAHLVTSGDLLCIDGSVMPPCIVAEIGLTFGCNDGLDNDGDGFIDAADPQCLTPDSAEDQSGIGRLRLVQCNDGQDNDGDGLVDSDDSGCLGTVDDSEGGGLVATACSDGLDNDGDGAIDLEDADCAAGSLWTSESTPACDEDNSDCPQPVGDVCFDGFDNDGDGATDLADPGCTSPTSPEEIGESPVCQDGQDNDGDGLVDHPDDPDCFRATGDGERSNTIHEFGPLSVDPDGRYVYVVDRRGSQVVILDVETGALMDPNDCLGRPEDPLCRRRPWDSAVGLPVARLPTVIFARIIELEEEELEDGRTMTRKLHVANVASTSGVVYYAEAAVISTFDGEEIVDPKVRIGDFNPASATVSGLTCSLTAEVRDYVRESRSGAGTEIRCGLTEELPSIVSPDGACTPAGDTDDTCICENPDDPSTCVINPDKLTPIALLMRHETRFDDDPDAAQVTIERVEEDVTDDYYILNEAWTVTYEGTILSRSDATVESNPTGVIRTASGNFCTAGLQKGDHLSIESPPTPSSDVQEGDCDAFENAELVWRIAEVSASYLVIEPIEEGAPDAHPLPEDVESRVAVLPTRECFATGLFVDVRPVDTWVVSGSSTGLLVNTDSAGNACVPQLFSTGDYGFRAYSDAEFASPWFRFRIKSGSLAPRRDFQFSFRTNRNFASGSSNSLSAGPSPSQLLELETVQGSYIPIVDSGNNTILVFDGSTERFVELLF